MRLEPILPDTAVTVLSPYWTRPAVPSDAAAMDPDQYASLILIQPLVHSCTVLYHDQPLCVWGIVPRTATEAIIFLFRHSEAALMAHAVPVARHLYQTWQAWVPACPYARIVCRAALGDPAIDRLLRWLGFVPTGHLSDSPHGYMLAEYAWQKGGGLSAPD